MFFILRNRDVLSFWRTHNDAKKGYENYGQRWELRRILEVHKNDEIYFPLST